LHPEAAIASLPVSTLGGLDKCQSDKNDVDYASRVVVPVPMVGNQDQITGGCVYGGGDEVEI
jgi:hypothetical protein